jgi:hypothetical protein
MIQMAGKYVEATKENIIFLLNAYFPSAASFNTAEAINMKQNSQSVTLVMRGKSNTVAFEEPEIVKKTGPGRPRIYGKKIVFKDLFKNCLKDFQTATINLYGRKEIVQYYCINLLWKPISRKLRFVLVNP